MSKIAKVWIMMDYAKGLTQFNILEHGESKRFFCTEWDLPNGSWILLETSMVWEHQPPITTPRKRWNHFCPGTTLCLLGSWWSAALKEWQLDKTYYKTYKNIRFSHLPLCNIAHRAQWYRDYAQWAIDTPSAAGIACSRVTSASPPKCRVPCRCVRMWAFAWPARLGRHRSKMSIDDNNRRG